MSTPPSIQQWTSSIVQTTVKPKIFLFYRAYSKWQQSSEIKILQTFLESQGLYSSSIDGIYSKATTNAVYDFQKKYSLISDDDPLLLRGFLGPKTRAKINEIRSS
jgi:peptidoglycan hydrolase-like protein with peptidoglycan-binding domain